MFEEKTYENIMQDMLAQADGVDTSEGSLMYEAIAKTAVQNESTYADMSRLYDNLSVADMEEKFFTVFAEDRGVYRIKATLPVVLCRVKQPLESGTRFTCGDFDYTVTEFLEQNGEIYYYLATCETAGTEANNNIGEIYPIDYIEDWQDGVVESVYTHGREQESLEDYKARFKDLRYSIKPFAGNKAAYRNYISAYNEMHGGAADCIPLRTTDRETIEVWVVDAEYKALTDIVKAAIQEYIDPVSSSGEGDGTAPIGHKVIINTPVNVETNIITDITLESNYSWDGVKESITAKIREYLLTVRKLWSKNKKCTVRISQIEYAALSVEGVIDCTGTTINGSTGNLELDYTKVPVIGSVEHG